jgi:MerR HTH family regulatory protein/GAF domain
MEQLSTRILERSSDAIVIVRLVDRTLLGANEAFFAVTGHRQHELARRDVYDLFVPLRFIDSWKDLVGTEDFTELSDAPIGLWTRAGELRYGYLSALVLHSDGQADAVCAIRGIRDPMPDERRLAARERVVRTLAAGGPRLEVATRAIRALGESLRWEFGALWLRAPGPAATLRCTAAWRSPLADLQALEEASWRTTVDPGVGLVGWCWRDGHAVWVTDAGTVPDLDPRLQLEQAGEKLHGWFGFPVRAGDAPIGVVEFFSPEARQPDEELLELTEELGSRIGRLLENPEGRAAPPQRTVAPGPWARQRSLEGPPGEMVSSALRQLMASIGRLDQLLERAVAPQHQGDLEPGEAAVDTSLDGDAPPRIPTGVTLKAVSRRTGVPAATLRTWERRYGFVHPMRSASGYRLYGDEEIARVLQVKHLLEQGVRIGEAMAMVRAAQHPQAG